MVKIYEKPLGKHEVVDTCRKVNGIEGKSGVPGAIDKHTGRKRFSAVLSTPCGALCEPRLTSVREVRVG